MVDYTELISKNDGRGEGLAVLGRGLWHTKRALRGTSDDADRRAARPAQADRQETDHLGLNAYLATCFPNVSAGGKQLGRGHDRADGPPPSARKRTQRRRSSARASTSSAVPLCGRNLNTTPRIRRWPEKCRSAHTRRVQSNRHRRCLCSAHFAANSQETLRMTSDSVGRAHPA